MFRAHRHVQPNEQVAPFMNKSVLLSYKTFGEDYCRYNICDTLAVTSGCRDRFKFVEDT